MPRYHWCALNKQQVGTYFEYFVKMELTMHGYEVYTSEVDDRAIDFVARRGSGFVEIQVKCLRDYGYAFIPKSLFKPREDVYIALGLLFDGKEPEAYLVPSTVWLAPNAVFVERDYDAPGQKSRPEWGINVSRKNMAALEKYVFANTLGDPPTEA
jgi:hypothetical protein